MHVTQIFEQDHPVLQQSPSSPYMTTSFLAFQEFTLAADEK
jgi:hypothetical protein